MSDAIENCIDCPHHVVVNDPEPGDWFCDDDVAVLCVKLPNINPSDDTHWASGKPWPHAKVTQSCRPYNIRRECVTPDWCPLKVGQ